MRWSKARESAVGGMSLARGGARGVARGGALAGMVLAAGAATASPLAEQAVELANIPTLRCDTQGHVFADGQGGYGQRDGCPQVSSHTNTSFEGGTYAAQGGFAEGEIAAVSYTLSPGSFPARLSMMEFVFAQQNAIVTTTTQYVVMIWNGNPNTGTLLGEFESDPSGFPLPELVMPPGTQGRNIQVSIDPSDAEQIILMGDDPTTPRTFSIGIKIVHHNNQTANPCNSAPPANRNAFPVTDNTSSACGVGYAQLNQPTRNWLFGVNCGPNGCPANGGWTTFANLQADFSILGQCISGCRPRGDWVIRATWDPTNCPGVPGGCCFGTVGCVDVLDATGCANAGGTFLGPGLTCEDANGNGRADICEAPPANVLPVAEAGDNSEFVDDDNDGYAQVVFDGSASGDSDGTIVSYAWDLAGVQVAQSTNAIATGLLPQGNNLVRLVVTDDRGGTDEDYVLVSVLPGGSACPGCAADYDQDGGVTGADLAAFFADYEAGLPCADVDQDGGITGGDVGAFFAVFEVGGC